MPHCGMLAAKPTEGMASRNFTQPALSQRKETGLVLLCVYCSPTMANRPLSVSNASKRAGSISVASTQLAGLRLLLRYFFQRNQQQIFFPSFRRKGHRLRQHQCFQFEDILRHVGFLAIHHCHNLRAVALREDG